MIARKNWVGSAALLAVSIQIAGGQQVEGALAMSGGAATDVRGISSHALTLSPSVALSADPRALFALDGSATRFDTHQWSVGAGVGTALRAPFGPHAAFTLNATGNATKTSYDFSYMTASLLPALEVSAGPVTAYAAAHGSAASTRLTVGSQPVTGFPGGPSMSSSQRVTSASARGVVVGANAVFVSADAATLRLGLRDERGTIDTMPTVDRGVSLSIASGRVLVGGNAGMRSERSVRSTFGGASLSIAIAPAASLEFAGGTYPADRLVGTPGGRFVNVGVSLRTGRRSNSWPAPLETRGAPAAIVGMTRLAIRAADASRVELAGDFTNWKTIAAQRASNGVWYVDLRLPPGQYRYAFRVNEGAWRVPEGAAAVDDDFGGKSAWLYVAAPGTMAR